MMTRQGPVAKLFAPYLHGSRHCRMHWALLHLQRIAQKLVEKGVTSSDGTFYLAVRGGKGIEHHYH